MANIGTLNLSTLTLLDLDALADYAKCAQDNGMVPIVEPEVLMDGDHNIDECYQATERSLKSLFNHLEKRGVNIKWRRQY